MNKNMPLPPRLAKMDQEFPAKAGRGQKSGFGDVAGDMGRSKGKKVASKAGKAAGMGKAVNYGGKGGKVSVGKKGGDGSNLNRGTASKKKKAGI